MISEENKLRKYPLAFPEEPPIFADYEVKLHIGYHKYWSPYYINGFYFGLQNDSMPVQYVLPGSWIFLTEAQKYFDSRQSSTFPRWVSQAFETHRQYGLNIVTDGQRPQLIDANIRLINACYIEVRKMENIDENGKLLHRGERGRIAFSRFYCRKYESNAELQHYLETGNGGTDLPTFVNHGDIFKVFDSFEHRADYFPEDNEKSDFTLLPFYKHGAQIPKALEIFYKPGEPSERRSPPKKKGKGEKG